MFIFSGLALHKTLKTLACFSKIFSPCSLPSLTQCSYPLLNKQLKDYSRTHSHFSRTPFSAKKEPWVYTFFSSSTTWVILSCRSFCVCSFFFGVQLNYKISTEIQGPSGTECNFQGLSWPWISFLNSTTFKMRANPDNNIRRDTVSMLK